MNKDTKDLLLESLCNEDILKTITWGLHKDDESLGVALNWDEISFHSSGAIEDSTLTKWIDGLKTSEIIEKCEIIENEE